MTAKKTDEIWRLYRREWVIVHTASDFSDAEQCAREAQKWIVDNLAGRVQKTDIRLTLNTDSGATFWCHVEVFKDNLKGEFKLRSDAEMYALAQQYDEYTMVPRNSAADHTIRNYGVTKL